MGKRTTKAPEEENLENVGQETTVDNNGIRCVATDDNDGVALVDSDGQTLLVVALNEAELAFGGDES